MAMSALAKVFGGGKKGEPPSPQQAIQKLRETEEMLSKKSEFLEKRIEKELASAKKAGMKNKRGLFLLCFKL
jgi:charged multivesicular body protein 4